MVSLPSTVEKSQWVELFRCNELHQARAVATCVAAMEFDVRLISAASRSAETGVDDPNEDVPGPYVIQVPVEHSRDLADVLREIIDEQREFDERIALRQQRRQYKLLLVLSSAGVVQGLIIWRLMDA